MAKGDLDTTAAWQSLNLYLPTRTHDEDYWWQKSGPQLAALVEGAEYPLAKQYEALLFHYHWMVPYMGPSPLPEGAARQWKSLLQPDGTPIEYSWKWNTSRSPPDIRYDIEPIGPLAGTKADPLNQHALREMLHRLADQVPNVDLTWCDHFLSTLFDHDLSKYVAESAAGKRPTTSGVIAAEFLESGTRFKTYFQPRKLGYTGIIPMKMWDEALEPIDPQRAARSMVKDFPESTAAGQTLTCFSIAVDVVKLEKSRLKWYFNTPSTAFSIVREVMTLGGRLSSPH
ncbi:hypothetical protein KC367_g5297 [Hortaea werneckii]|nr:hypothetical protein KC367_g5297 [Hortaea werneckii]